MKRGIIFCSIFLVAFQARLPGQDNLSPDIPKLLRESTKDKDQVHRFYDSVGYYAWRVPEAGLAYAKSALAISRELNYEMGEAMSYLAIGYCQRQLGDYAGAIELGFKVLNRFKEQGDSSGIAWAEYVQGGAFKDQEDYRQAIHYYLSSRSRIAHFDKGLQLMHLNIPPAMALAYNSIELADCYNEIRNDSAMIYAQDAFRFFSPLKNWQYPYLVIGKAHVNLKNYDSALYYFNEGLTLTQEQNPTDIVKLNIAIAKIFEKTGAMDSVIFHAKRAVEIAHNMAYLRGEYEASELLAGAYERIDPRQSIQYYKLSRLIGDSLFNLQKSRDIQNISFRQELKDREIQQKLKESDLRHQSRLNILMLSGGIFLLLIISVGLWRRTVFKNKAFALLEKQKQDIEKQKSKTEDALLTLKSTQSQLIQSEKMASLGELTVGIAHEIQNPLNFVNNFSELSGELIEEAQEEIEKGDLEKIKFILQDLKDNLSKINHHGKRAGSIVKGMLEHSRKSDGKKERTDLNQLADECLRLSFHGLRAKDKSFASEFNTDLDPGLPELDVVPQDIARVLLNLINNAFYAVNEKAKEHPDGYTPRVTVSSKKINSGVKISISDNGPGIPDPIKDKIFQPFFTTKPTGQGTGLGLSLSYDIVTKGHGGALTLETTEGVGSVFTLTLPVNT